MEILNFNIDSYEFITGKSLAMILFKENNCVYLLRGTTISPYMSEQLYKDIKEAIKLGFTIKDIVDLYDNSDSLELLGTTLETFQNHSNDDWNWHKWSFNQNGNNRFWTYISRGIVIREV